MAYTSVRGRKPFERASRISHAEIIANSHVQRFLSECSVPRPPESSVITNVLTNISQSDTSRIQAVIAIDGGYRETPVREEFPSASFTFFTFGPLLFKLEDLRH